mmetsp:Transcript_78565/g.230482  ORF Transcript_78565/g.230482 Transcript_78565/m.230482 type:complete len:201 (+) Transcript_78565:109-711(+)
MAVTPRESTPRNFLRVEQDEESTSIREASCALGGSGSQKSFLHRYKEAVMVAGTLLAFAAIWGPIYYFGMMRQVLGAILGPALTSLTALALVPLILSPFIDQLLSLREEFHGYMTNHKRELKVAIERSVDRTVDKKFESLPGRLEEIEHRMLRHLQEVPEHVRRAVSEEFAAMRHAASGEAEKLARGLPGSLHRPGGARR